MIRTATSTEDFAAFGDVVTAYVGWCRERYAHDAWFVDQVFGHQSLATELADLSAAYAAPNGRTLLAFDDDGRVCGGGAYRRLPDGSCEMMRLDTGNLLREAIAMYASFGFAFSAPHHEYPEELMPYLVFMERALDDAPMAERSRGAGA